METPSQAFLILLAGLPFTGGLPRPLDFSLAAVQNNQCGELNISRIHELQDYLYVAEKYPAPTSLAQSLHFFGRDLKALGCYPSCTEPELSPSAKLELRLAQIFETPINGVTATVGMWTAIIDLIDHRLSSDEEQHPICDLGSGTGGLMVAFAEMEGALNGTRTIKGIEYDDQVATIARQNLVEAACIYEELGDRRTAERLRTQTVVVGGDAFLLTGTYSVLNSGFAVAAPPQRWIDALAVGGWIGAPICYEPAFDGSRGAQTVYECRAFYSRYDRTNAADSEGAIGTRATLYDGKAYLNATTMKDGEPVPILFVTAPVNV